MAVEYNVGWGNLSSCGKALPTYCISVYMFSPSHIIEQELGITIRTHTTKRGSNNESVFFVYNVSSR